MEWNRGEYVLTDDPTRFDLEKICTLLQATYWAGTRSRTVITTAIQHSVCIGMLWRTEQIGFARAVTDRATFAWIADVIVAPEHRGSGLGKWMVGVLLEHPAVQTITQLLRTRDAHSLYEHFGFERAECMRRSQEAREGPESSTGLPASPGQS
jgi:GNAT superfamily N-acetyltransferase